jgi:ABC-type uncharacterized transport system substrate-binding protein
MGTIGQDTAHPLMCAFGAPELSAMGIAKLVANRKCLFRFHVSKADVFVAIDGSPQLDLVTSINRPGSNVTGVIQTNVEVARKRLQLLHELVPAASVIGLLVNPTNPPLAETNTKELRAAARTLGLELHVLNVAPQMSAFDPKRTFSTDTMGIVVVAAFAASAAGVPVAAITAT